MYRTSSPHSIIPLKATTRGAHVSFTRKAFSSSIFFPVCSSGFSFTVTSGFGFRNDVQYSFLIRILTFITDPAPEKYYKGGRRTVKKLFWGRTCDSRIRILLWIRIRILLSSCKNSKKYLDSYYFVTLFYFLSLKNYVNVASKIICRKKLC
jgi:hypothetical protein